MRHIPDQIYLQLYGADQRDMEDTQAAPEITWCKDLIYDTDELYVRHTHYARALREKDALFQQLRRLQEKIPIHPEESRHE